MRSHLFFGLVATVALLATGLAHAETSGNIKIGYVDMQRALHEVDEGKAARNKLKAEFEQKQKDLNEKQERLQKLRDDLETQGMMMNEKVRRQKAEEYQALMMELQQSLMEHQQDLAEKEAQATGHILNRMEGIVRKLAKEGNFTYVFERNQAGLVVAPQHMDITNELIRLFNDQSQKERAAQKKKK